MYSDLDFIKGFSKIKIAPICKKLHIDKSNLWAGRLSQDKVRQVKDEILKELNKLDQKK